MRDVMAMDDADDAVATVRVTTRDNAPPVFRAGSPSVLVGGGFVQLAVAADEPGRVYFVVVRPGVLYHPRHSV